MRIKTIAVSLLATCLFFVAGFFATSANAAVTNIHFTPPAISPQPGEDIQVDLGIEVAGTSATYSDVTLNIPTEITVKTITNGGFFDNLVHPAVTNGKLELHGYFNDPSGAKTGVGNLAHLTLTSSKVLGSSVLTFQCDGSGNDTGIISVSGQNILTCSILNKLTLTYPNNTNPTSSPYAIVNGNAYSAPNACGGTCGSNYNCDGGLFCFQGFCRNPDCQESLSCGCPTPTPTPKATAKSKVKPTPEVVILAKTTPYPTPAPSSLPVATPFVASGANANSMSLLVWAGLGFAAIIVIVIVVNSLKKKNPPQITPPTTFPVNPPVQPPQNF